MKVYTADMENLNESTKQLREAYNIPSKVNIRTGDIWQCNRDCFSRGNTYENGLKAEVVGSINDGLTRDLIIRTGKGIFRIYDNFFLKHFFLLNRKG